MEQAQFGVLEMDWFIASLQPMRWIKSLAGVHAPAGGAHILRSRLCCELGYCGISDKQ
jgi:hypothetical protein